MYLTFFGLNEKPFTTAPDPRFLYLSPGHREALAHLVYGVEERVGFLMLTGGVGSGKTTLLQALLQRLNGDSDVAFLVNSGLRFDDLLAYLLTEFGIAEPGESRIQRLFALKRFLLAPNRAGRRAVLILDEAQNLDLEALEHIRMLSNFETPSQKLLQIVLVGQPSLKATLECPELRQLQQRIALRATIQPLSPAETVEYVWCRLRIAGALDFGIFSERAVRAIADYARGIPRVVNIVGDHCLLRGYADQKRRLDVDVVNETIRYLQDRMARRGRPRGGEGASPLRRDRSQERRPQGRGYGRSHTGRWRWLFDRRFARAALTPLLLGLVALPAWRWEAFQTVSQRVAVFVSTLIHSARELLGS
jgi:general secretion pathway protein A